MLVTQEPRLSFLARACITGEIVFHNKAVILPVFSSEYGWAGQNKTSGPGPLVYGSVKEVVEKISLHTVDKIMKRIKVRSMTNEEFDVSL